MRRERLTTRPSPDSRHDFLVELRGEPMAGTRLTVRFVPDALVLEPAGLVAYLGELTDVAEGLEALAMAVLDDLNNELVPRWVEITAERDTPFPHRVVIEDRQPNWDNPALVARLRRL
ncbi:tunnelling fold family protein [Azospirillum agricola]|uniref:hypothetical protein n=1 Tax=Azospirillum agricola TaxID=1720247 RepID=UPI000A0F063F|nr:hypothetical protein [Azospirillum agricola]SMH47531.1 hypothetical protein SAMN02982994_2617 [Azospirillum lipoferum]